MNKREEITNTDIDNHTLIKVRKSSKGVEETESKF